MRKNRKGVPSVKSIIGISLDLQGKILGLIKALVEEKRKMTGAIILVEGVGHGFCLGVTNKEQLNAAAEYFQNNNLAYKFSVVEVVLKMTAGHLMHRIHRYNEEAGLPGILNYLESRRQAA
jgi:hypothetical protein